MWKILLKPFLLMRNQDYKNIFFYDGDCGFCNGTVLFLLDRIAPDQLSFSSMQSDFAKKFFISMNLGPIDLSSSYLYDGQEVHKDSDAILKSLRLSSNIPIKYLGHTLAIVPKFIRNYFYKLIAINRLTISSVSRKGCRLLTSEEQKRFIVL